MVLGALLGLGCESLDPDRRPYTPFPVATGAAGQAGQAAVPPPVPAPPAPAAPLELQIAPSRAVSWRVAERELTAPDGLLFRLALVGGVQGGAERDVLAWAVGTPEHPSIGELWLYPESGDPRLIMAAPASCRRGQAAATARA